MTHIKLKLFDIVFIHNIHFSCPIILKYCTEHGSDTAVLYAIFQNNLGTEKYVASKQVFSQNVCFGEPRILQEYPGVIKDAS